MKVVIPVFRHGLNGYTYSVNVAVTFNASGECLAHVFEDVPGMRISTRTGEPEWQQIRAIAFRRGEPISLTPFEQLSARSEISELLNHWQRCKAQLAA